MTTAELFAHLVVENILLRTENADLKKRLANSVPVTKEYQIGDLAAIFKNVVEENKR